MSVAISDGDFGGKGGRSEARRHLEGLESEGKHRAARVFARGGDGWVLVDLYLSRVIWALVGLTFYQARGEVKVGAGPKKGERPLNPPILK